MSEYFDRVRKSYEEGNSENFFDQPAPQQPQAPVSTPALPEDFEVVDAEEASPILGNVVGIGAEIGTGLYLTKRLHRSQQFLAWANRAKTASVAAIATPEPASTVAGIGTFALTEAAIWGASNIIGQNIRKAYGVQDNVSAGEVLASSVFGVGLVTKQGQKLLELGDGLAKMKAWGKGNELFVNGTKSFVSGAVLGIAETALRQEAQILLNEKENRDVMEYVIGGAAGGGFNTLFDVFSRTGKWGQAKAKKITEKAKESLEAKAVELEQRAEKAAPRAKPKLNNEIKKIRRSIEAVDDLGQQLTEASKNLNEKKPKTEQPKEPEATETPLEASKTPEPTPTPSKDPETPSSTTEGAGNASLTPRQQEIEALSARLVEMDSDSMSKEMPNIERDAKRIYTNIHDEITVNVRKLEHDNDPEAVGTLLELVQDLRTLNLDVKDVVETTAGRSLQAARRDAAKYHWSDMYSLRSQREDANLALLEETLESAQGKTVAEQKELSAVNELLDDAKRRDEYIDPVKEPKKDAKSKGKKEAKQATPEEVATKAKEQLEKKKAKAQEELDAKRKEFNIFSDTDAAGNTYVRNLSDEEIDAEINGRKEKPTKEQDAELAEIKTRIKYYDDVIKETETISQLEAKLGRLAEIEGEGNLTQLRNETTAKPKAPSDASPKIQELNTKIAESKARMRGKLRDIENAQKKMEVEDHHRFRARLMKDIEGALYSAMEVDGASRLTKGLRWIAQSRQLALINQLPSALAGVPTGAIAMLREINRSAGNYVSKKSAGTPLAGEMAKIDLVQAMDNFRYMFSAENRKAVKRTLKENQSATDPRRAGKLDEDINRPTIPRGEAELVARARRRAEKAAKAQKSLVDRAAVEGSDPLLTRLNQKYLFAQSLGVRLIQGLDEGFKRPLMLGRVKASARKEALLELEELKQAEGIQYTPKDLDKLAKEKHDNALIDSDGLTVLRANHEYMEEVDLARQELLFAANSDNIEEVVAPYSEKIVQSIKRHIGDDHAISFAIQAIMPYVGVPIRGVYKGLAWTTAAPRSVGKVFGGDVMGNPYIGKLKAAQDELAVLEKLEKERGDTPFNDRGKEAVQTLDGAKKEILEKIQRTDARRIQYNADTLADALMAVELVGIMSLAAAAGEGTGSMSFLSDDQKEKMGLTGIKPFKLFGMDYKAIGPAAFPMVVAGDLRHFFKIRKFEAQSGTTILDEDLTWMDVIVESLKSLAIDQPLSSGVKQITEILGNDEQRKIATSSMLSSATVVPAQVKKAIQHYNNAGRMVDLKGSTFSERLAYGALGVGISNFKTDYFGYDMEDPRGFIQNNIMRQWPDARKTRTELDNIIGSDLVGSIQAKPEYLQTGIRMKDFVDERGVTMTYRFDQELKNTKIRGKTMREAVNDKIFSNRWRKKFQSPSVPEGDLMVNQGLVELNDLMRSYYDKTREKIAKNTIITDRYINSDNETLADVIERFNNGDFLPDAGPVNLADILKPQ